MRAQSRTLPVPLTPAHAAAVVPLCRWKPYFWLSPLAVGSMAPDFAYFVFPPHSLRPFGHTPWGLVAFCIPAGLATLFVFHRFLKRPLVLLLPQPARGKLWRHCGPFPLLPWRRLAWICALIYLGAVTHVFWDGFTHDEGWAVRDYPQMKLAAIEFSRSELRWSGLLQYGSSLLGLGLLAWWSWQWYRRAPIGRLPADPAFLRRARPAIATAMILFAAVVGISCGLAYACNVPGPFDFREFLTAAFVTGVDAFGLVLLLFAAAVGMRTWSTERATRHPGHYYLLRDLNVYPRTSEERE